MTSPLGINQDENLIPADIPSSPGNPQNNQLLFGDSLGRAAAPVALNIPLGEYANLVGTARYKNAQELHDIEITSAILFKARGDSFAALAIVLSQLRDSLINFYNLWVNVANLKPSVDNAIIAYNNANPKDDAAKAAYAKAIAPYNDAVKKANGAQAVVNLPFAPTPTGSTPIPTPFTIPQVPSSESLFLAQYYVPFVTGTVQANINNLSQLSALKGFLLAQSSQLNTSDITLPAAFIDRNPQILLDSPSEADTGGNSLYSSMAVGLGNVNFEQVLSQPIFTAALQQAKTASHVTSGLNAVEFGVSGGLPLELRARQAEMPGIPVSISHIDLIAQLQLQAFHLLAQSVSEAAAQTVQLLPKKLGVPDLASPAFDSISALAFAKSIRNLINSNAVEEQIQAVVANTPSSANLSGDQQKVLVDQLTAVQKLALLRLGISQIDIAFKTPGLGAQLFGNALKNTPGLPPVADLLQEQPGEQLNQVLQNPFSQILLATNLAASLQVGSPNAGAIAGSPSNTPAQGAQQTQPEGQLAINQAINQVALRGAIQPVQNEQELQAQFLNAFSNTGFPIPIAAELAQTATTQVKTEAAIPFLGLAYTPAQLRKALNAAPNFSISTLDTADNEKVKLALATISHQGETAFASYSDLHTRLVKELILLEVSRSSAQILANQAILFFKPKAEIGGSRATGTAAAALTAHMNEQGKQAFTLLPPEILAEQLHALIEAELVPATGKPSAKAIADQFTPAIIGTNSVQTQLGTQLNVLKGIDDKGVLDDLGKQIRMLGSPNVPLYIIKDRIDQAVRFEAGAPMPSYVNPATGSLQSDKEASEPLNFKRDISIKI